MQLIKKEDLTCVFLLEDIKDSIEQFFDYFMIHDDEVIYILSQELLYGIISIRDLTSYFFRGNKMEVINREFKSVKSIDDPHLNEILREHPKIHEVPMVDSTKKFVGVIRTSVKRTEAEWEEFRQTLVTEKQKYEWKWRDIDELFSKIPAQKLVFKAPNIDEVSKYHRYIRNYCNELKKEKNPYDVLKDFTEKKLKVFFGEDYEPGDRESLIQCLQEITYEYRKGIYCINDIKNKWFDIENGTRHVPACVSEGKRKIVFVGPCIVLGQFVSGDDTIENYFQKILVENGMEEFEVVNLGMQGIAQVQNRIISYPLCENDIVIFITMQAECLYKNLDLKEYRGEYCGDLSIAYRDIRTPEKYMLEDPIHCNYLVNKRIATVIFENIVDRLQLGNVEKCERRIVSEYYIGYEIIEHFKKVRNKYNKKYRENGKIGAVVMNCNPFTKGHRYLVEYASRKVDLLYIFVVEEDKSYFHFNDRFQMVMDGTCHINNVVVEPSSNFIISCKTFSQYFDKDRVTEVEDVEYDLQIFGQVVAKELNISIRFVGEEPFDKVTKNYNEAMKRVLPEYGVVVEEIPRLKDGNYVISASRVRKSLEDGKIETGLLPDSTIYYLKKHMGKMKESNWEQRK